MLVDGKDAVLGRLGTVIAKKALLGEEVNVVNCDKIIISGKKEIIFAKYKRFTDMGTPRKGPFYPRDVEKFAKRIIRGMLPYKQEKGRTAFERIKFYKGIPKNFEGQDMQKFGDKPLTVSFVTLQDVVSHIGGKQ